MFQSKDPEQPMQCDHGLEHDQTAGVQADMGLCQSHMT